MANSKQAKWRVRRADKQHTLRKGQRSEIATYVKRIRTLIATKKVTEAKEVFKTLTKRLGQLTAKKVLHKNKASRWLSRLNAQIKAAS